MQVSEKNRHANAETPVMRKFGTLIWFATKKNYFESHKMLHQLYMRLLTPTESVLWIANNKEAMKSFGGNDLYLGEENSPESTVGLEIKRHGYSILRDNGKLEKASRCEIERHIEKQTLPEDPIIYNYTGPNPIVLGIYKSRVDGRDLIMDGSHNPSKKTSIVIGVWDTMRMEREGIARECARD